MTLSKNTRKWIHSLVAAAIGGAANGVTVMIVSPQDFNLGAGLAKLAQVVVVGSLIGVAALLKQSPLPPEDDAAKP